MRIGSRLGNPYASSIAGIRAILKARTMAPDEVYAIEKPAEMAGDRNGADVLDSISDEIVMVVESSNSMTSLRHMLDECEIVHTE